MNAGDKVAIYEDPITCRKFEGEAVLIKRLSLGPDSERWRVRFEGEEETYERWVAKETVESLKGDFYDGEVG